MNWLMNGKENKQTATIKFTAPKNIKRFLDESIHDDPKAVPDNKYPVESPAALAVQSKDTAWWPTPICLND